MIESTADINYITEGPVGQVIAEGLAVLYKAKPVHPVDYLAKWFLNYSATQKNLELEEVEEKQQLENIQKYKEYQDILKEQLELKAQEAQRAEKVEEDYRKEVTSHEYHHELLPQSLANFIEKQKGFSGVYIGQFDYPTREINDDQDDEFAHLDTTAPRQLNYIGASDSHKFMIGKSLPPPDSEIAQTKTVTYQVFREGDQDAPADADDNPDQIVEKTSYLYVPDVTTEERMYYFRIPRLGAYLACPLIYNSCLHPEALDAGVEGRKKFFEDKAELEERKRLKLEERDEKLADVEEGTEEYQRIVDQYNEEINAFEVPVEAPFLTVKKEYVVCVDTLGQDREITEEERKYVEDLVKLFAQSWEEKEAKLLSQDIDRQLEITKDLVVQDFVEEYTKRIEEEAENRDIPSDAEELEKEYIMQTGRVEFLKEFLFQESTKSHIQSLTQLRVLKFQGVIQNALYLIGYDKKDINIPGTNLLNWKVVKNFINDEDFFNRIQAYEWVGPKGPVEKYAYINRILRRTDELMQRAEEVDKYNVGLGVLLRFLRHVADLRIKDIKKRRLEKTRLMEMWHIITDEDFSPQCLLRTRYLITCSRSILIR